MKYIQVENGLIIKSWCDAPEYGAIEQAKNLARHVLKLGNYILNFPMIFNGQEVGFY